MKKVLAILLTMCLSVGLTACLEEDSSTPKKDSQKTESSVSAIELPEDKFH